MVEACGTPAYMAPEVVEVGEQSKEMVKLTAMSMLLFSKTMYEARPGALKGAVTVTIKY